MPPLVPLNHSAFLSKIAGKIAAGSKSGKTAVNSGVQTVYGAPSVVNPQPMLPSQQIATGSKVIQAEQRTLSTTVLVPGQTYVVGGGDIGSLHLEMSFTAGGTYAATDFANLISYIQIQNSDGSYTSNIPGGTFLYDNYTRFTQPVPSAVLSNTIAANASSGSAVIDIPNILLPAALGPYRVTFYYGTVPSGATTFALTNQWSIIFAPCGGIRTCYSYQNQPLVVGQNHFESVAAPMNVPIVDVMFRSLSAITDIQYFRIVNDGQVVESYLTEINVHQRAIQRFNNAFETTTLPLLEPNEFVLKPGANTEFVINSTVADAAAQEVWIYRR
jgi:hypothetical protein